MTDAHDDPSDPEANDFDSPEAHVELLDAIERLWEDALLGQITGLAAAVLFQDGSTGSFYLGTAMENMPATIGAVEILKAALMRQVRVEELE